MKNRIQIREVVSPGDLTAFLRFPWQIYRYDPNWVPPLMVAEKALFNPRKNPFWKAHEYALFMAYYEGIPRARIAVFLSRANDQEIGHFGFWEMSNDEQIALELWRAAENWFLAKGVRTVQGPYNPSLHHQSGVLLEGFERPPFLMMPYNPAYYPGIYEKAGLEKAMDFRAYSIVRARSILNTRLKPVTDYLLRKHRLTVRSADPKHRAAEFVILRDLYNASFHNHWGFSPLDQESFDHLANDLLQVADPDLILIAEKDTIPVGFVIGVPNFNEILIKIRNGRLLPLGLIRILLQRKKIRTVRVMTLGVLPDYRKYGVAPLLMRKITEKIIEKGYIGGEISWVAEDNFAMNKLADDIDGHPWKKTRIYQKNM